MAIIATSEHSHHHDISDVQRMRVGRELLGERLRANTAEDPSAIHTLVMEGTVEAYRAFDIVPPKERPNFLIHMMQVNMVTSSLLDAVTHKPDGSELSQEEKREIKRQGGMYAGIHDIGRILDIPDLPHIRRSDMHAINGRTLLHEFLPGENDKYMRFAYGHHNWGLYMEFPNPHNGGALEEGFKPVLAARADAKRRVEGAFKWFRKYFKRSAYNSALHNEQMKAQDQALNELVNHYDQTFGIAGIAAVVADLSKAYIDPVDIHRSVIDDLTPEKGEALLERQISFGSYDRNSPRHLNEIMGVQFILKLIDRMREAYGVDYHEAIGDAKEKWEGYVIDSLNREWEELTAKPAQEQVA